jgi:hypothetical protein
MRMKPEFRSHITWWDSLTKKDKATRFRFLSEKTWNYKDLPTWSQNSVKIFFDENKETLEAEASFRSAYPDVEPMSWQPESFREENK